LQVRRREFIARLGAAGAYAAVPRLALAQQGTRARRVAILQQLSDIQLVTTIVATIRNELAKLGWVEGRNLQIDVRYGRADVDRMRPNATELIGLDPDVIIAVGITMTAIVQQQTQTIPIVFGGGDALARGLVKDLAHPEGNTTGVNLLFQSMAGKWVQLLKEAVPRLQHVGYFCSTRVDPQLEDYYPQVGEASRLLGVRAERIPVGNAADIARFAYQARSNAQHHQRDGSTCVPVPRLARTSQLDKRGGKMPCGNERIALCVSQEKRTAAGMKKPGTRECPAVCFTFH
jgi:putative tryptophan/tyrosine transport system substrate-binding protein